MITLNNLIIYFKGQIQLTSGTLSTKKEYTFQANSHWSIHKKAPKQNVRPDSELFVTLQEINTNKKIQLPANLFIIIMTSDSESIYFKSKKEAGLGPTIDIK
jgi:hypothetical protein